VRRVEREPNEVEVDFQEAPQREAEVVEASGLKPPEPRRGHVIGVARQMPSPKVMGPLPPDDDPLGPLAA
jgi:hypothetical protein